jgi:hypothetical protein
MLEAMLSKNMKDIDEVLASDGPIFWGGLPSNNHGHSDDLRLKAPSRRNAAHRPPEELGAGSGPANGLIVYSHPRQQ